MKRILDDFLFKCGLQPGGFSMANAEVRQEPPKPVGPTPEQIAFERRQAEERAHYDRVVAETRAQMERAARDRMAQEQRASQERIAQDLRWSQMREAEQRRAQEMNDAERRNFEKMNDEARRKGVGGSGGGSSGGSSGGNGGSGSDGSKWFGGHGPSADDPGFASRRFNYERVAEYPWQADKGHDQYKQTGPDTWETPWGRTYSKHAIDQMMDNGRQLSAQHIEKTIAYGRIEPYRDYQDQHNRVLGGFIVGVTTGETKVITALRHRRYKR